MTLLAVTIISSSKMEDKKWATRGLMIIIILTSAHNILTRLFLGGVVWGVDEWWNMSNALRIEYLGLISPAETGYYIIPVVSQVLSFTSTITSLPMMAVSALLSVLFSAVFLLSIYIVSVVLTGNRRIGLILTLVASYTPRLVLNVQPLYMSIVLASVMLILFVKNLQKASLPKRMFFITSLVLWPAIVFSHPSGVLFFLFFLGLTFFFNYKLQDFLRIKSTRNHSARPRDMFFLFSSSAIAYWIFPDQILRLLQTQISNILRSLQLNVSLQESYYQPLYSQIGVQFAVLWAIPLALAVGYYSNMLFFRRYALRSAANSLGLGCFVGGTLLLMISFLAIVNSSSLNTDRYLGTPAYFLLIISLVPAIGLALSRSRITSGILLTTLVISISIGTTLPDISPDLHRSVFEPPTRRSIEWSEMVFELLPDEAVIAKTKNFREPLSYRSYEEQSFLRFDPSYKIVRATLNEIESNEQKISDFPDVLFVIDSSSRPLFLKQVEERVNILVDGGEYLILRYHGMPEAGRP